MNHKPLLTFLLVFCMVNAFAQTLQSPENFLGYKLGSRFTLHHKIVGYFEAVARAVPQKIRLEKYGETNEGKPLLLAIVASPTNLENIEEIRKNNLRLTGLLNDKPGNANAPVIVWLSYNVHGNEASSSEAAMKVLYELLSGQNASLTEWMKNTVVIIDPCLNPDGRDRYANFMAQVSGTMPNADPSSREHDEPWPGGRTNHYNYDLNRDWAWQTQVESQQRLKKYHEWMPQIHCDFHEQGTSSPYYFAPAAEPVHEAVTQWQRDVQVTIGKNHAKYFDKNGWLYFTKQYFDLFYPSYGDTYPLFNGSIGMTYEQAGGPRGGTAYALQGGDTLTLEDRIEHHFTTSLSTIEVAADNATKFLSSFKKYFDDSKAGLKSEFKSYVVPAKNYIKPDKLIELLTKNKISYGYASSAISIKGFNYFSDKEETINLQKADLIIPAAQPKAALLKVLFEQKPKLSDSATYDITAWALPYVYGLQTYGVKENIAISNELADPKSKVALNQNAYGYIVPYNSINDVQFLNAVLDDNVKVRFTETAFTFSTTIFPAGSLLILRKGNEDKIASVSSAAEKFKTDIKAISSGFVDAGFDFGSDKIRLLKNPNVALLTGEGSYSASVGEVWHLFEKEINKPITLINVNDFNIRDLKNYNVLIISDGYYKLLANKEAAADLKNWVRDGGKLIVTEGAAKQVAGLDWGLKMKKASDDKQDSSKLYSDIKIYAEREKESVVNNIPGAIYKMQLDKTHPLGFGFPTFYYTLKLNENVFEFMKDGWNVGVIKKQSPVAGFVGSKIKQTLKDGVLIGELPLGNGSVIFFADNPIFRSFWENGKMLFCNAVFFAGE